MFLTWFLLSRGGEKNKLNQGEFHKVELFLKKISFVGILRKGEWRENTSALKAVIHRRYLLDVANIDRLENVGYCLPGLSACSCGMDEKEKIKILILLREAKMRRWDRCVSVRRCVIVLSMNPTSLSFILFHCYIDWRVSPGRENPKIFLSLEGGVGEVGGGVSLSCKEEASWLLTSSWNTCHHSMLSLFFMFIID